MILALPGCCGFVAVKTITRSLVELLLDTEKDVSRLVFSPLSISKRGRQRQRREARNIFLSNPYILLNISLLWLQLLFLFFAEITLTPASPSERNDGVGS